MTNEQIIKLLEEVYFQSKYALNIESKLQNNSKSKFLKEQLEIIKEIINENEVN